ncbi:xylose isomerase-like isoform X1 [Aristolochia californica]|uniref:xylose isomerase-like isoform X1 n=1 Tax=Aristolochia californica TaxID=171875 RepID=UPI0035D8B804
MLEVIIKAVHFWDFLCLSNGGSLCIFVVLDILISVGPPTCPSDVDAKCDDGASDEREGEFFPDVPQIKYENPLAFKWYNAEEVILRKKMKTKNLS